MDKRTDYEARLWVIGPKEGGKNNKTGAFPSCLLLFELRVNHFQGKVAALSDTAEIQSIYKSFDFSTPEPVSHGLSQHTI